MSYLSFYNECLRKKKLKSSWADAIITRAHKSGTTLGKYLCPHCQMWHVTSNPRYKTTEAILNNQPTPKIKKLLKANVVEAKPKKSQAIEKLTPNTCSSNFKCYTTYGMGQYLHVTQLKGLLFYQCDKCEEFHKILDLVL